VLLSSSSALLQSFPVGAASGPAFLLSAPRRFLRQLLRAEPDVTTSSGSLQPSAPDVCYYGRHELLRAAYQRETGMLQRCRQSSPVMVGQRSHGERRLLQWQAMNATIVDSVRVSSAKMGLGRRPRRSWMATSPELECWMRVMAKLTAPMATGSGSPCA
jgi:hypothetical protein